MGIRRDYWPIALAVLVLVSFDQVTKLWIQMNLALTASIPIVADVVHFSYYANYGAVTGIGSDIPWFRPFLIVMGGLTIVAVMGGYELYRTRLGESWRAQAFVTTSVAPLLSTLIDRVRQGFVVDFIHIPGWPIFNFADLLPDFAAAFLIIEMVALTRRHRAARRRAARRQAPASSGGLPAPEAVG